MYGMLTVNGILLLHLSHKKTEIQGYDRNKRTLMRLNRQGI